MYENNVKFDILRIHRYTAINGSKLFSVISRLFTLKSHQDDIKEHKAHCSGCDLEICKEKYNES